jgi:GT2 family glycosyltransferase
VAPPASLVVCTRDRPSAAERCLLAVAAGTALPDEVVLVDQGDAELPRAFAALTAAGVELNHHRVERMGTSRARNRGIAAARNELVVFTDDDCVPDARWLEHLLPAAAAGGASGRVLPLPDETPGLVPVSSRVANERRTFRPGDRTLPWEVGTGGNLAARRDYLDRVNGFDERLGPGTPFAAAEDIDLIDRLLQAGCEFVYEPGAVVLHEMKTRRDRLRTRYPYGRGMGAFLALRSGAAEPTRAYLSLQGRSLLRGASRLRAWQTAEGICTLGGFAAGFASAKLGRRRGSYKTSLQG